MIDKETIDLIISKSSLLDTISEYVNLKKKGVNYVGSCPFHTEATASFVVSPSKNIYKYFGCGKGGNNPVSFLMEIEGFTYTQAVIHLANKAGISVNNTEQTPEETKENNLKQSVSLVTRFASDYFHSLVSSGQEYISLRGISKDMIEKFKIGYSKDSWNEFKDFALSKQFNSDILLKASLISESKNKTFDYFRNRLILPYIDVMCNPIGFTGRITTNNNDKKEAKYLNSKDTAIFKKGNNLFGLYQAKKEILSSDKCFFVEGNLDVITFHQYGIENTVCGSGTALTIEQVKLLKRFTNNVTVIYDADPAGIKASFKSIDLFLSQGINVKAIKLPAKHDPDSFARTFSPPVLGGAGVVDLKIWLYNHELDFIEFKYDFFNKLIKKDPPKESEYIRDLITSISLIPDEITRALYIRKCTVKFKIKDTIINDVIKKIPEKVLEKQNNWIGLEFAADHIADNDKVYITSEKQLMINQWNSGDYNTISYDGNVSSHILDIRKITNNIYILDEVKQLFDDKDNLQPLFTLCNLLYKYHFNILLPFDFSSEFIKNIEEYDKTPSLEISYINYYFLLTSEYLIKNNYDNFKRNRAIELAAELFSKSDITTINTKTKDFSKKLNLAEIDFKKVLKPYLAKHNSKIAFQSEYSDNSEKLNLDPDNLPEYVDKGFLNKWGYFPYQNSKGDKVRYVFKTMESGLQIIGNFFIEPLFHVYSKDRTKNKRIIKVNNAEQNRSFYLELKSDEMADFASFKKVLFNEGGNWFSKDKSHHYDMIMASISCRFPMVYEIDVFGQQPEGFYAFANAVYENNEVRFMDEYGIINVKSINYYSPAFGIVHKETRSDDIYENERFFIYKENKEVTFETWSALFNEVFKLNDNGKWALLISILAAFRSYIFQIDRLFTTLFFIGPTESGKSKIATSISALYLRPESPLFNLNTGTDAVFFTLLEKLRDVAIVMEEYNDFNISNAKFEGLKSAVYDNQGKQKRKDASSKDIDSSKINSTPILLGQLAPMKNDGSLANRCIICNVPKKNDWTQKEVENLNLLKSYENKGLSHILIDILSKRKIIETHFRSTLKYCTNTLKAEMISEKIQYQTRVLNTVSLFLAITKVFEDHIPELKLPFTYAEFYEIAKTKLITQSDSISTTSSLSNFFDVCELLLNRQHDGIIHGREFKIEVENSLTIIKSRSTEQIKFEQPTKVLYLKLNLIHQLYCQVTKDETLKNINNLLTYIKDHNSFIGLVKSTRFVYMDVRDVPDPEHDNKVTKKGIQVSTNTSAYAFNYEILKDIVDFERYSYEDKVANFESESNIKKSDWIKPETETEVPF